MGRIDRAWKDGANMVPVIMDALKHKVTMGECHKLCVKRRASRSVREGGER